MKHVKSFERDRESDRDRERQRQICIHEYMYRVILYFQDEK